MILQALSYNKISLIFKTANAGDGSFKEQLGNIWSVPSQTFDKNKTINFDSSFSEALEKDEAILDEFIRTANGANFATSEIEARMRGASASAIDFAKNNTLSANSVADFANQQRMSYVANMAQGTSLSNIQMLLNEYNSSLDKSTNGITKCGLSQKDFVDSVNQSNAGLGGYLSGLNGANASMKGYIGSLVKAKISTIGLQLATTALNAVVSFGISLAIQGVIKLWDEWVVTAKEAIEKSEEAADTIKSINDEFNSNKDKVDEIAEKYAKLAQGVDSLTGKNVSLTDDDYEEFLDLSNQLAEIFPTLTRGYDENGNAILNLNGDVNTIVGSLNNLLDVERQLANQKILDDAEDLFKGIKEKSKNYEDEIESINDDISSLEQSFSESKERFSDSLNGQKLTFGFDISGRDIYETRELEDYWIKAIKKALDDENRNILTEEDTINNRISIKTTQFSSEELKKIEKEFDNIIENVGNVYNRKIVELDKKLLLTTEENKQNWSGMLSTVGAFLNENDTYNVISDDLQGIVQSIVNGLDYSSLDFKNLTEMKNYIQDNILDLFTGDNSEIISAAINKMNTAFSQFQAGEISYDDYKIAVDSLLESLGKIDNLTSDQKEALTMTFGIKFAEDGTTSTAYDNLVENVKGKFDKTTDDIEGKVKGMSLEDLKIASQLEIPDGTILSWKDLQEEVKKAKNAIEEADEANKTFTSRMSDIQGLQAGLDQLDKIYADIADGKDFDYSAVLNNKDFTEAFSGLGESYNKFMETILNSPNDLSACQSAFNDLVGAYINGSGKLNDLTEETKQSTIAFLEQMGIANASIIVEQKLNEAKVDNIMSTEGETEAMMDACDQAGLTVESFIDLATSKLDVSRNSLNLSSDIQTLYDLAAAANMSASSLKALSQAKSIISQAEGYVEKANEHRENIKNGVGREDANRISANWLENQADILYNQAEEILSDAFKSPDITTPTYKGGSTYRDSVDKASKEAEKNEPEKYDWITTSIERTEREIQNAQKVADSAYKSLDTKLAATDKQIKGITKEIEIQNKALKKYKKEADSVKLSEDIKAKVRDGSISIDKYDDKTQELINDYKEWYEKSLDCADAIAELDEELTSLYDKKFDDISTDYENQLSQIEHLTNTYENNLADLEARGYLGGQEYYAALQDTERQKIALLEKQLADLTEAMNTAIDEGMEVNSPKWYNMQESINSVKEEIQASNTALIEYQNSIDELDWEAFDFMQERISAVADEAQFLIKLLDDSDLINDKGRITGKGFAVAGLHVVSYNTYMKQSEEYAKKILEINAKLAKDPSNTELIKQREELLQLQRESILAAKDEKDAIIDMIEESIKKKIDAMKELIDTYKDSLRSAKDLYDYQKRIKDQTSNITSLQKQLAAYENDDSEETRAKVQQIRVDLEKAKDELEETEYDKFISDTEKMLDNFYEDYEDTLNARMDNIEMLLSTIIDTISFGVNGISSIIQLVAGIFGYTVSDGMTSILGGSGNVIGEYGMPSFDFSSISSTIDGFVSVLSGAISTGIEIASGIIGYFTPKKAYKTGGLVDYTGVAQLDGTPSKPELVLNSRDTENFIQLKDALRQMAENDVQLLPSSNYINGLSSVVPHGILDMSSHISKYREPQENSYSVSVGDINTTIEIDHVMDYDDFVSQAKNDPQFERFIGSLTLDRLVGGSNLAKYKYWK